MHISLITQTHTHAHLFINYIFLRFNFINIDYYYECLDVFIQDFLRITTTPADSMLALLVSSSYSHSITAIIVSLDSLHAAAPIQSQLMRHSMPAIAVVIVDIISITTIITTTATKPTMITTIITMKMRLTTIIIIIITIVDVTITITITAVVVVAAVIHATNAIIMPKQAMASHSSHFHSVPLHKYT